MFATSFWTHLLTLIRLINVVICKQPTIFPVKHTAHLSWIFAVGFSVTRCIYGVPLAVFKSFLFSAYFTGPCKFPQRSCKHALFCSGNTVWYDCSAPCAMLEKWLLALWMGQKLDAMLCSLSETESHPHFPVQAATSHEYRSSKVQAV